MMFIPVIDIAGTQADYTYRAFITTVAVRPPLSSNATVCKNRCDISTLTKSHAKSSLLVFPRFFFHGNVRSLVIGPTFAVAQCREVAWALGQDSRRAAACFR